MSTPSDSDAPPTAPPAGPSQDDRNLAMFAHAGGILTGFVVPLLIWLQKKELPFVAEHAKEALNFQVTLHIGDVVALIVMGLAGWIGMLLWLPVLIARLGLGILGVMAAMEGKPFKYVVNLRLIQ